MAGEWWQERLYPTVAQAFVLNILLDTHSDYQHLVIAENDVVGRMLILDGIVQITERDAAVYQEMMAHVPILGGERPAERVLIIGGGDGAIAREALRHPEVRQVVMVELDQGVIDACQQWLPSLTCDHSDPRMQLVVGDGAAYVKTAAGGAFDAIIVDSPDPIGPAEVLFGSDFYTDVRHCLSEGGAAVFQSGVPFFQEEETAGIVRRLRELFAQVAVYQAAVPTYYGGSMALGLASKSARPFSAPCLDFDGQYYNADIHRAAFALPTWWRSALALA